MEQVKEDRFVFQVEWFDKQADLIRNYLLTFYPGDGSIDMVSAAEPRSSAPFSAKVWSKGFLIRLSNLISWRLLVRFEKQEDVPQENARSRRRYAPTFRRFHRYRQR